MEVNVFDSMEAAPRKWKYPATGIVISLIGIAIYALRYMEHRPLDHWWLPVAMLGFLLVFSLYHLYWAFQRGVKG